VNVTTKFQFPWKALYLSPSTAVPILFALACPLAANCTLRISEMLVINIVAVISNSHVDVCAYFRH